VFDHELTDTSIRLVRNLRLAKQREFVHPALLMEGRPSRIDPDRGRLLIMEFQNCVVGSAA